MNLPDPIYPTDALYAGIRTQYEKTGHPQELLFKGCFWAAIQDNDTLYFTPTRQATSFDSTYGQSSFSR